MVSREERKYPVRYPRLIRRVQAVLIDGILFSVTLMGAGALISSTELGPPLKIGFVALLLFILEPGLVAFAGATIGHRLRGLRVERARDGGNIDIFRATVRFLVKTFLGLPSVFFVLVTKRHQAFHDLAVGSVVVFREGSAISELESLPERVIEETGFEYPSKLRRFMVIVAYVLGSLTLFSLLSAALVTKGCLYSDRCTGAEHYIQTALGIGWLLAFFALISLGWRGLLWGARRTELRRTPHGEWVKPE